MKAKDLLKQLQALTPKQLNLPIMNEAEDVGRDREIVYFDTGSKIRFTDVEGGREMWDEDENGKQIKNKETCIVIPVVGL